MISRAATHQAKAVSFHPFCESFGVDDNLFLVLFKTRLECFQEANGFGGDDMHEGTALYPRKSLGINFFGVFFFEKNQPTSRASEGLMSGGGYKISRKQKARRGTGDVQPDCVSD